MPAICFIGLTILAASKVGILIYELVADPGKITKQPSHLGFLSQVGNLLWCATTTICLFSAYIVRAERIVRSKRLFLYCSQACFQGNCCLMISSGYMKSGQNFVWLRGCHFNCGSKFCGDACFCNLWFVCNCFFYQFQKSDIALKLSIFIVGNLLFRAVDFSGHDSRYNTGTSPC